MENIIRPRRYSQPWKHSVSFPGSIFSDRFFGVAPPLTCQSLQVLGPLMVLTDFTRGVFVRNPLTFGNLQQARNHCEPHIHGLCIVYINGLFGCRAKVWGQMNNYTVVQKILSNIGSYLELFISSLGTQKETFHKDWFLYNR